LAGGSFTSIGGQTRNRIACVKVLAEAIVAECQGQPVARVSEEKKASSQIAPRLYDLTTLQREARVLDAGKARSMFRAMFEIGDGDHNLRRACGFIGVHKVNVEQKVKTRATKNRETG
jgi:hypothetical protein